MVVQQVTLKTAIIMITILVIFIGGVYIIARQWSSSCSTGMTYDTSQKKCRISCPDETTVYSSDYNKCIPKDCGIAKIWRNECGKCGSVCTDDKPYFNCNTNICECNPTEEQCQTVCCPKGLCRDGVCCTQSCNVDGKDTCCEGGTICLNNKCVSPCGPEGTTNTCLTGENCIKVSNIPESRIQQLRDDSEGKSVSFDGNTMYMCNSSQPTCEFGEEASLPTVSNNYYPCYNLLKRDTDYGLGFCFSSDPSKSSPDCYTNNGTKNDCIKAGCEWNNIFDSTGQALSGDTTTFMNAIRSTQSQSEYGFYCNPDPDKTSFSRIVGRKATAASDCTWKDCWSQLAHSGVTDLEYDASTGVCTALQSCDNKGGLTTNSINQIPIINKDRLTMFPTCPASKCPIDNNILVCSANGQIIKPAVKTGCSEMLLGTWTIPTPQSKTKNDRQMNGFAAGPMYSGWFDFVAYVGDTFTVKKGSDSNTFITTSNPIITVMDPTMPVFPNGSIVVDPGKTTFTMTLSYPSNFNPSYVMNTTTFTGNLDCSNTQSFNAVFKLLSFIPINKKYPNGLTTGGDINLNFTFNKSS